ncbi:DUF2190 family protein [Vibrio sp. YMD68]|uniref:capsid cement protein n=1 Tax=Vibrio sp. YMD68 TaxID=3042300 RepID=UPI00249B6E3E|nr:capsid cement protein [Vibrio sp. YMD68]WGV98832.1 DUF2190 family protein [Vibrio sp. YMD68]WGW01241.1 DUF2190 family protein [Vibrio sp. YMD68]
MPGLERAVTNLTFTCIGKVTSGYFMNVNRTQADSGDDVWGVVRTDGTDEPVSVAISGDTQAYASGAFSEGDELEVGDGGTVVKFSGAGKAVGRAFEDAEPGDCPRILVYQTK